MQTLFFALRPVNLRYCWLLGHWLGFSKLSFMMAPKTSIFSFMRLSSKKTIFLIYFSFCILQTVFTMTFIFFARIPVIIQLEKS